MRLSDRPVRRRGSWKRIIWYLFLLAIIIDYDVEDVSNRPLAAHVTVTDRFT